MDYPKLRNIEAIPVEANGQQLIYLRDPESIAPDGVALTPEAFFIVSMFDGEHSLVDIQTEYTRRFGEILFGEKIGKLVESLDENLLMDSDRFRSFRANVEDEFRAAEVRGPAHAGGAYEADADKLRGQLDACLKLWKGYDGPSDERPIRGAIAPHIDPARGEECYGRAYGALRDLCDAELFVILGIAHLPVESLFVLTEKDFETPLGRIRTDRDFTATLSDACSDDLLKNELLHKAEHSIEFQAIFLQHIFGGERDVSIVPILCGSFHEFVLSGKEPAEDERVAGFASALREAIRATEKRTCVVCGVDLAHLGGRFGDQGWLSDATLKRVESSDRELLGLVQSGDAKGLFRHISENGDARRICGFPALYTFLLTADRIEGCVLDYGQNVDMETQSVVSFAGAIFR